MNTHTRWERDKFYHRQWKTRGKDALRSFSTNSNIPCNLTWFAFSQMSKVSVSSEWWNHKNNHLFALPSHDRQIVMKTKYPVHVMVFSLVTSNSDVIPPFIMLLLFMSGWLVEFKALGYLIPLSLLIAICVKYALPSLYTTSKMRDKVKFKPSTTGSNLGFSFC